MHEQKLQKGSEEWVDELLMQLKTSRITEIDLADFIQYVFEHSTDEELIRKLSETRILNEELTDSISPTNDPEQLNDDESPNAE